MSVPGFLLLLAFFRLLFQSELYFLGFESSKSSTCRPCSWSWFRLSSLCCTIALAAEVLLLLRCLSSLELCFHNADFLSWLLSLVPSLWSSCCSLLQKRVGNPPPRDTGPPLRHAVLCCTRSALHVSLHSKGPDLVLLRCVVQYELENGEVKGLLLPGVLSFSPGLFLSSLSYSLSLELFSNGSFSFSFQKWNMPQWQLESYLRSKPRELWESASRFLEPPFSSLPPISHVRRLKFCSKCPDWGRSGLIYKRRLQGDTSRTDWSQSSALLSWRGEGGEYVW